MACYLNAAVIIAIIVAIVAIVAIVNTVVVVGGAHDFREDAQAVDDKTTSGYDFERALDSMQKRVVHSVVVVVMVLGGRRRSCRFFFYF
jgi:hypothetical protein